MQDHDSIVGGFEFKNQLPFRISGYSRGMLP
jgi:hypothetical protein